MSIHYEDIFASEAGKPLAQQAAEFKEFRPWLRALYEDYQDFNKQAPGSDSVSHLWKTWKKMELMLRAATYVMSIESKAELPANAQQHLLAVPEWDNICETAVRGLYSHINELMVDIQGMDASTIQYAQESIYRTSARLDDLLDRCAEAYEFYQSQEALPEADGEVGYLRKLIMEYVQADVLPELKALNADFKKMVETVPLPTEAERVAVMEKRETAQAATTHAEGAVDMGDGPIDPEAGDIKPIIAAKPAPKVAERVIVLPPTQSRLEARPGGWSATITNFPPAGPSKS